MVDAENDNDGEEGEVPMLHLASFALHKLFTEWQAEGFEIPDFKMGTGSTSPIENAVAEKVAHVPGTPPKRTQLPDNAGTMHPTTLLCMVKSNHFSPLEQYLRFFFVFTDASIDKIRGFRQRRSSAKYFTSCWCRS